MHAPAPSTNNASSPAVQQLSSQPHSRDTSSSNIPNAFPSSSRDTTPVPSSTSRSGTNTISTQPAASVAPPLAPSVPDCQPVLDSITASHTSQGRAPIISRRPIGVAEAPIDLRGLSLLPTAHASAAAIVAASGVCRQVNLPTLKNPQGELLDLSELAGCGDGLTPTQETFSINITPSMHSQSPMLPGSLCSPSLQYNSSAYQSPTVASLSSSPSMSSYQSLASLTSNLPSLSSFSSLSGSSAQSPSSQQSSPTFGAAGGGNAGGLKTPNVYINGLPPNFPEEELLAMTKSFGEVISVRTFTRHVSDKPSGYGFVLFGSVDAAEKCIESLRKYRNLHPSFSKQVHKIPGTTYAAAHAEAAATVPQASENPDSFKTKMEKLKDQSSTNLYMEGLPLTITEEELQALVKPHKIMSSRLFRTRLSDPPRIIAFVRLEDRHAAEEIISRLHGRMVVGWRDTGSRISVRFADTSEQRELRRNERVNRDGENSPARLTMAQAALLNLTGTQLGSRLPSPNFGVVGLPPVIGTASPIAEPAFVATQTGTIKPLPPPIGLHHQQQLSHPIVQPLIHTANTYAGGINSAHLDHNAAISGLHGAYRGAGATDAELLQMRLGVGASLAAQAARTQNGYTQMEQLLLQAHEQQAQFAASAGVFVPSNIANVPPRYAAGARPSDFNPSAAEFNPSALAPVGRLKAPIATPSVASTERRRLMDFLPAMSEKDFHARGQQTVAVPKVDPGSSPAQMGPPPPPQVSKPLKFDHDSRIQFTRQRNQTHAEAKAQAQAEAEARARSTTMPSHYLNTDVTRSIHSSIHSPPSSSDVTNTTTTAFHIAQTNNHDSGGTSAGSLGTTIDRFQSSEGPTSSDNRTRGGVPTDKIVSSPSTQNLQPQPRQARIDTTTMHNRHTTSDEEDDGSGLDSPALSYSARTSASLSPATPFSAFGETFEGPPMAKGHEVGLGMGVGDGQMHVVTSAAKQIPAAHASKLSVVVSAGADNANH